MGMIVNGFGIRRLGCLMLIAALAAGWSAQSSAAQPAFPCAEEIGKYCKGLQLGSGHIQNCLKEHEATLSASCKSKLEASIAHHEEIKARCGADVERLCKDVKPGRGRIVQCLKTHHRQVSSSCKDTLAAAGKAGGRANSEPQVQGGGK